MGVWSLMRNGEEIVWNNYEKQWEYSNGDICIQGKRKKICVKCGKPQLDINGVENCDFCLQGLTTSDFIADACCGHNNPDDAYIALKDGRRFVLDNKD